MIKFCRKINLMRMYTGIIKAFLIASLTLVVFLITGCSIKGTQDSDKSGSEEWKQLVDLTGVWKFSVGDDPDWASPSFNDHNWERIEVPSSWENQGFHGYDGYAWYRNTFEISQKYKNNYTYLFLGFIDDVDQVFINGKLVGSSGSFPPGYRTAYDFSRRYPVPSGVLNFDKENTIAVRVYDDELEGGILRSDHGIGIYTPDFSWQEGINLAGSWKFRTGDNPDWKESNVNDSNWSDLIVPGYWETQGFPDYDGFAWYRKSVFIPEKYKSEKLVLLLGKIDDLDETYLNGKLVGSTGNMNIRDLGDNYQKLRGYYLSRNNIKYGTNNLIAVRVYDGFRDGGIYDGPVTIIPQKEYTEYWNRLRNGENIFDKIFE